MVFKFVPYSGSEHEIDMLKPWYCPHCSRNLMLSADRYVLFCPAHFDDCDYEFHNAKSRRKYQVVWHAGYQYPITKLQVTEKIKKELLSERKRLNEALKENQKQLQKVDEELILTDWSK